VASSLLRIEKGVLERQTLSDVLYYFKGQRASVSSTRRPARALEGRSDRVVDAHGAGTTPPGDYGKHLSHLRIRRTSTRSRFP
jgi:hypothetical protein